MVNRVHLTELVASIRSAKPRLQLDVAYLQTRIVDLLLATGWTYASEQGRLFQQAVADKPSTMELAAEFERAGDRPPLSGPGSMFDRPPLSGPG